MQSKSLDGYNSNTDSTSTAKNSRQPEESGPFGRNRSIRYTSSSVGAGRRASTRAGTTPQRQKENTAVNDFSRLYAKEQAQQSHEIPPETESNPAEKIPTECLLYGYASKTIEWKVISRFERIAAPGIICEDYDREDPELYQNSGSPMSFNRSNLPKQRNLSREAMTKARVYRGGQHWIKVTFDSWESAERAVFYSPVEIDGCLVHCEPWNGKGPVADVPIPRGVEDAGSLLSANAKSKARTLGGVGGRSAISGFEQALNASTLPRNQTFPGAQFAQPTSLDDMEIESATASSATATGELQRANESGLRSRSVPNLSTQSVTKGIKRTVLRPISEALPPQRSVMDRILSSIPVVSWLLGYSAATKPGLTGEKNAVDFSEQGPIVKEDGTWDKEHNNYYWKVWHLMDSTLGTDFCGLKED